MHIGSVVVVIGEAEEDVFKLRTIDEIFHLALRELTSVWKNLVLRSPPLFHLILAFSIQLSSSSFNSLLSSFFSEHLFRTSSLSSPSLLCSSLASSNWISSRKYFKVSLNLPLMNLAHLFIAWRMTRNFLLREVTGFACRNLWGYELSVWLSIAEKFARFSQAKSK